MDTSETYVNMCCCEELKAYGEIPEETDFYKKHVRRSGGCVHPNDLHFVWLPRQDQIQEMMYELPPFKEKWTIGVARVACPNCITLDLKDFSEDDCKMLLESMEQLWLAFYMHEKHQKTWDKEKWVDLEGK